MVDGPPPADRTLRVKIRNRHEGADARVQTNPEGKVTVVLDQPARAVTPGQAAVFYEEDRVLGGGWIG